MTGFYAQAQRSEAGPAEAELTDTFISLLFTTQRRRQGLSIRPTTPPPCPLRLKLLHRGELIHDPTILALQLQLTLPPCRSRQVRVTGKLHSSDRTPSLLTPLRSVVAADGLAKRDVFRLPDPFAVVTVDGEQTVTTSPIKKT